MYFDLFVFKVNFLIAVEVFVEKKDFALKIAGMIPKLNLTAVHCMRYRVTREQLLVNIIHIFLWMCIKLIFCFSVETMSSPD